MLTENDLRDALHNAATPPRRLVADAIVRRGHRRRVAARSAAGAGAVAAVAVVGVSGLALSGGSAPSSAAGQAGLLPTPQGSAPPSAASASVVGIPIATGAFAPLPSASAMQSAPANALLPPPEPTSVPAGTARAVTSIPFGSGTVAYSLRPEPVLHNADAILLDLAGTDGTLTIKVDGGIPAQATKASWWYGEDPEHPSWWVVYGAVPAGATHVTLYIDGKPVATPLTAVPGATALAFTLIGRQPSFSPRGPISKLTYVDAAGRTVSALSADSESRG